MSTMAKIRIRELGPREGFQTIKKIIPIEQKLKLISLLSQTGVKDIEVTSFVRSEKIPQMADAEAVAEKFEATQGIRYTALYLNEKGFERSIASKKLKTDGWLYTAASETFLNKNNNTTQAEVLEKIPSWIKLFAANGGILHGLMLSTAFGCSYEGKISPEKVWSVMRAVCDRVRDEGGELKEICLADTMGWGNPRLVKEVIEGAREVSPNSEITLHLHDTRGTGIANAAAGIELGIKTFDASVGGMGGCPFAPGASGNIATEDLAFLCEEMGFSTGLDLAAYAKAAEFASSIVGYELPGKYYKSVKKIPSC